MAWEAMPEQTEKKNAVPKTLGSLGLTLAEAKKGLALTFVTEPKAKEGQNHKRTVSPSLLRR